LILAVDDEFLVLELIVGALKDGGYEVVEARSASDAMAILLDRAADLAGIVTDVNLGRGQTSGWEVVKLARELNRQIAAVYLTGDSAHEWAVLGVPGSVMLDKPFAMAEVVVALAQARATS
jgi:CheY-like chemotaxis protein